MALEEYRRKRIFTKTAEPRGRVAKTPRGQLRFVVQKHAASRLHYDFRLEMAGVLKSWAVPKGPSLDPGDKRLAVHVEDHPVDYIDFEGTIPEGQYGGGTVMLWDRGTWAPIGDAAEGYAKGNLKFTLAGARMKGNWALVRMNGRGGGKNWLLIKERDARAKPGHGTDLVEQFQRSVESRRSMDGIAKDHDRVWQSKAKSKRGAAPALAAAAERRAEPRRESAAKPLPKARAARFPALPKPELATLVDAAPEGDDWLHEIKFDGYRMLALLDDGEVKILSRNGLDWTKRLPELVEAVAALPVKSAVLDGEVVHLEKNGISSFSALKNDLSAEDTAGLIYYLFDLLYLDGKSLTDAPLTERKAALAEVIGGDGTGPLRISEHIIGKGGAFFEKARDAKLEGIISKRCAAPYRAGRTGDWLKIKSVANDEFIIIGWTDPGSQRTGFGALLLGYYDAAGELHFAGGVGTGFSADTLALLRKKLDRLKRDGSPAKDATGAAPRHAHWVRPELVAQIRYSEWTPDRHLRHPAFLGLREDKPAREVVIGSSVAPPPSPAPPPKKARARAAASSTATVKKSAGEKSSGKKSSNEKSAAPVGKEAAEVAGVRLTHPGKLLYPDDGITKLDLANYYVAIAEHMLPHLRGRPLTMVRCPDGLAGQRFYQKHPGDYAPPALGRIEIEEKEGRTFYLLADDVQGLVSLVQMSALEIHVWGSTKRSLEKPDRVIFDLDPDEGLAWDRIGEAAVTVRDFLAEMGLDSFVKTTGGKGLHVVLPLAPKLDWEEIKLFARSVAAELVRREPNAYTATLSKKARHGKIFIDYLRNQRGATAIAAYSARARAGATVAAPLTWAEVEKGWRSDRFTIATLPDRLKRLKRDPWEGLLELKQSLPAGVRRRLRAET